MSSARTAALVVMLSVVSSWACAAPKYVILFIGDGMGPEQVKAAGMYANGEAGTLSFEKMPVWTTLTTDCAGGVVTDSAAAATAIACGRKVEKGVLSRAVPGDEKDLETLLEYYKKQGRSVGLVTTSFLTDATPAAFVSHADKRGDFNDVVDGYLKKNRPDIFMGGNKHIKAAEAVKAGYTVFTNKQEMASAPMMAGLFGTKGVMPYAVEPESAKYPTLSEMTIAAIRKLSTNRDGFFLMVEGGNIDHAGHVNKLLENVTETIALADAVSAAVGWANFKENAAIKDEILIVVTADHETGGLRVVKNNGKGNLPGVKWATKKHTGTPVDLYAWGNGSERLAAVKDNTEIRRAITDEKPLPSDEKKAEPKKEKSLEPARMGAAD